MIFSGDPYWATWSDAGFGNDGRHMVTGEDLVVVLGAQEANDAQLQDELVDDFLCILFSDEASGQVTLEVAVEECGQTATLQSS